MGRLELTLLDLDGSLELVLELSLVPEAEVGKLIGERARAARLSLLLLCDELGLDQDDGDGSLVPPGVVEDHPELPAVLSLDADFSRTILPLGFSGVLERDFSLLGDPKSGGFGRGLRPNLSLLHSPLKSGVRLESGAGRYSSTILTFLVLSSWRTILSGFSSFCFASLTECSILFLKFSLSACSLNSLL